jgi:hypothetical protein
MFPACSTDMERFAMPTSDVDPSDVTEFRDELWEVQSLFHDCLTRREPRAHCFDSMGAPYRALERQSSEPRALHVHVAAERGDPDGVLMFDETGFVQKGTDSSASPGSLVVPWGRWRMAKGTSLLGKHHGTALRWWTNGSSCWKRG